MPVGISWQCCPLATRGNVAHWLPTHAHTHARTHARARAHRSPFPSACTHRSHTKEPPPSGHCVRALTYQCVWCGVCERQGASAVAQAWGEGAPSVGHPTGLANGQNGHPGLQTGLANFFGLPPGPAGGGGDGLAAATAAVSSVATPPPVSVDASNAARLFLNRTFAASPSLPVSHSLNHSHSLPHTGPRV